MIVGFLVNQAPTDLQNKIFDKIIVIQTDRTFFLSVTTTCRIILTGHLFIKIYKSYLINDLFAALFYFQRNLNYVFKVVHAIKIPRKHNTEVYFVVLKARVLMYFGLMRKNTYTAGGLYENTKPTAVFQFLESARRIKSCFLEVS